MLIHYKDLAFFQVSDHFYPKNTKFGIDSIFKILSIYDNIHYLKVVAHHDFLIFDLVECDANGILLQKPYKNTAILSEIKTLIAENSWLLYKQSFGRQKPLRRKIKGHLAPKELKRKPKQVTTNKYAL